MADIDTLIDRHRGARGIVQLREVVRLADDGAESPQETRTRLLLTDAGLRPQRTQIDVFNRFGDHVHRIDMGWAKWKVGVEYDGEQHWSNPAIRAKDIDQQAELEELAHNPGQRPDPSLPPSHRRAAHAVRATGGGRAGLTVETEAVQAKA